MTDADALERFEVEVEYHGPDVYVLSLWDANCGKYLIDTSAERMVTNLRELIGLANAHLMDCDE